MKQARLILLFSLASFVAGFALSSARHGRLSYAQPGKADSSAPPASQQPSPAQTQNTQAEFPRLADDRYVTESNGTRLELDYGSWGGDADIPYLIDEAKLIPLKGGGLLVNLGDTLYRLDGKHRTVWAHSETQVIFDYALVEATNLIYGTAGDNVMFILDAASGEKLHGDSRNGSAAYGVALKYGNDMCLVTDYFAAYREKARGVTPPMSDRITCWRGTRGLWTQDFPPDAQLVVNGDRILAVTKTKTGIYVNEISVPKKSK